MRPATESSPTRRRSIIKPSVASRNKAARAERGQPTTYRRPPTETYARSYSGPGKVASRGGAASFRARKPIGNPGSRGKAPTTSGFRPNIRLGLPDLSGVGRGIGNAFSENPVDKAYKEIGNRIRRSMGG